MVAENNLKRCRRDLQENSAATTATKLHLLSDILDQGVTSLHKSLDGVKEHVTATANQNNKQMDARQKQFLQAFQEGLYKIPASIMTQINTSIYVVVQDAIRGASPRPGMFTKTSNKESLLIIETVVELDSSSGNFAIAYVAPTT